MTDTQTRASSMPETVSCVGSDQLPGLSERTLTLINLIWLAIAGFQITRLAAGFTVADQ
jgi:hypothetical protein